MIYLARTSVAFLPGGPLAFLRIKNRIQEKVPGKANRENQAVDAGMSKEKQYYGQVNIPVCPARPIYSTGREHQQQADRIVPADSRVFIKRIVPEGKKEFMKSSERRIPGQDKYDAGGD